MFVRAMHWFSLAVAISLCITRLAQAETKTFASHPPMRSLPAAQSRPMTEGPAYYVDAKGDDQQTGTREKPWRTLRHAVKQLKPGDTLYLRSGTYYESLTIPLRGTRDKPITIRSYPGELAIIDAGLREFCENPAAAWESVKDGAAGEFRSTKTYTCGGGFGNFADSMVPFHRYLNLYDLRSANEFYPRDIVARADDPRGVYCGPGTFRNPETGRIHVRLAHTKLPGLGENAFRGETDPRKLPLIVAGQDYAINIEGARHLRLQDLVVRGAQRAPVRIAEDAEDIEGDAEGIQLEGLTLYGSGAALQIQRVRGLKVLDCALRGHAAPWHSRAHHKYRAHAGYLVYAKGSDIEIGHCELTDHHDAIQMYFAEELRFHHNLVDNFNDDGIEAGPKQARGKMYIYQNVISRCLNPFTLHGDKPKPVETETGHGVYIFRNIVDLRQGVYRATPAEPDPSGAYLNSPTLVITHDHGSPVHPIYYIYHNTFLLPDSMYRSLYLYSLSSGTRGTTRRVFNNVFVQMAGISDQRIVGLTAEDDFQADGNLLWSLRDGPSYAENFFEKFRKSPLFEASKSRYPAGWSAHDLFADPKFAQLDLDPKTPIDLRLQMGSPAINAGIDLPTDWPDPLRGADQGKPDVGALPAGAAMLEVGMLKNWQQHRK